MTAGQAGSGLTARDDARRAVIFDWGGVLMRTADHSPRLGWDARLGRAPGTVEAVVHGIDAWQQAQRGEISEAAYWQAVGEQLGLNADGLAVLRGDFYRGDVLDADLAALIREVRGRGALVGLLSNNSPSLADDLQATGTADLFDAAVISCEIGVMKPDPAAYGAILGRLGAAPARALFIDDSPANVDGARAVGMAAVHYRPGMELRERILAWLDEKDE